MHPSGRLKDAAQTDPSQVYATPQELCESRTLSQDRKIGLLRQWEYDLRSMQVASEENMTSATGSSTGANAERLREVRHCLRVLGDAADEHAQTNKHGGNAVDN